jgi:hypothetical protein
MFLDPRQFNFVAALESQWKAIRDEYLSLPVDSFDPWVQRRTTRTVRAAFSCWTFSDRG